MLITCFLRSLIYQKHVPYSFIPKSNHFENNQNKVYKENIHIFVGERSAYPEVQFMQLNHQWRVKLMYTFTRADLDIKIDVWREF